MSRQELSARGRVCSPALPAAAFLVLSWAIPVRATDWTFMVYMNGDNDLERQAIDDFEDIAREGSGSGVEIIVQFDRGGRAANLYGGWTGCKRFNVTTGMSPVRAAQDTDLGEIDMADPAELTDFIDWAADRFPADRYALVLWGQGDGYRSVFEDSDDDAGGSSTLSVRELQTALADATIRIDLIGFAADLMGMLEVAYELRDAGPSGGPEVVVFSQDEIEPGGWPFRSILSELKSATDPMTATEFGTTIVDRFYDEYSLLEAQGQDVFYTMSAVDMSMIDTLVTDVGRLATQLRDPTWDTDRATVKALAQSALDSLDNAVYHELHGGKTAGAKGLSVYFPSLEAHLDPTGYAGATLDLAADTDWDEFLSSSYYASMIGSWVSDARRFSQEFRDDAFVDLGDFCERLVNHAIGSYYVDLIGAEMTGIDGVPKNWKGDEWSESLSLPFEFPFFGRKYTSVWVSDNGYLEFAATRPDPDKKNSMETLKSRAMIAPLWADLDTSQGDVYYHQNPLVNPTYACIRWVAQERSYHNDVEFELLLHKTGVVQFNYKGNFSFFKNYRSLLSYVPPPTVGVSAGHDLLYEPSFYDFVWDLQTTFSETYTACNPQILDFSSDPDTTVTPVAAGTLVTLSWTTQDMASVSIDNYLGDQDVTGSVVVTQGVTTEYTLTAVDPLGSSHTSSVTVRVEGITLVYPIGGEVLLSGQDMQIEWQASEFTGQLHIEFWDGTAWSDIFATTDDDGVEVWAAADVPDQDLPPWSLLPAPPVCKIRISDAADASPSYESAAFSILADTDADDMPDSWESHYFGDLSHDGTADTDADGYDGNGDGDWDDPEDVPMSDAEEYTYRTDPTDADSDDDLLLDGFEVAHDGLDPTDDWSGRDPATEPRDDLWDPDGDTLTNLEEQTLGTDPNSDDSDGDSLPDDWEAQYFDPADPTVLNPTLADSDGDGESDRDEDLDDDGYSNFQEYNRGSDPTDPLDPPPSGSTKSSGECSARTAGSAAGFGFWMLALVALGRRPVTARSE